MNNTQKHSRVSYEESVTHRLQLWQVPLACEALRRP